MSTLRISLAVQALDFSPLTRGYIRVRYNDGNIDYDLDLNLVTGIAGTYQFQEVPWVTGLNGESEDQAINYRNAFNRDYAQIGKLPTDLTRFNLLADVDGSDVVITAKRGTFDDANCSYSGNVLIVSFAAENTSGTSSPILVAPRSTTGNCATIDHELQASGGTPPYTVALNGSPVLSNWDGSASILSLNRGATATFLLTDSDSSTYQLVSSVPRSMTSGEFTIEKIVNLTSVNLTVIWRVPISGIDPLEYALEPQGAVTGSSWQSSSSFSGILPGTYELFIRDKFGCSVQKTVIVSANLDSSMAETPSYFEVMPGNSVIFSESKLFDKDNKPNFENTLSFNEKSVLNYATTQYFDPSDVIAVQFKSSYPYHIVTFLNCDGTKTDVPPVTIQNNLGVKEKVDCALFPLDISGTGVYFNGGNQYAPDTTNVVGASPYTTFIPYWVAEGQIVQIDGLGTFTIQGTGYDEVRQKDYFIIPTSVTSETVNQIQVTYNKQIYNLFEFRYSVASGVSGRFIIEKGLDFNNVIGNPWASELIVGKYDDDDDLLIEWSDNRNKGGIVFQSNIKFLRRIKGKFRPSFRGDSSIADTDSRSYNLSQSAYLQYELNIEGLTAKEVYQLCIASGLDGFKINNVPLVRPDFPEIEALGSTNLYNLTCTFNTGSDDLAIQKGEIVLDVSTGVTGGGTDSSEPYYLPLYDNKVRLKTTGGFVTVSGDFIAIE